VDEAYFDPTFGGLDWAKAHDRYKPQIAAAVYSGESGHLFRFKPDTDRSEATVDAHYTSLWPE
jgi:hypothetical protein